MEWEIILKGGILKPKNYIIEQINKKDKPLVQIFCKEDHFGEVIEGIIDEDFKFCGKLTDLRKELKKHLKGGDK